MLSMIKSKIGLILLLIAILLVGVSCHKHTFSDQWSSNADIHWHGSSCGHDVTADSAAHSWNNYKVSKNPTCSEDGIITYTCTVCGLTKSAHIAATGHNPEVHYGHEATCTQAGNRMYWSCRICGKYFSDPECTAEIEANSWIIPAMGHNPEIHDSQEATCTQTGSSVYWSCSRCGWYFLDAEAKNRITFEQTVIPKQGHILEKIPHNEPSCTEIGNEEYYHCTRCGKNFYTATAETEISSFDSISIPATNHIGTIMSHPSVPVTCIKDGSNEYWSCSVCGKCFSDPECTAEIEANSWIIPASGHNPEMHDSHEATCTQEGSNAYWTCTACGKNFSDSKCTTEIEMDSWFIPALGHVGKNGICERCGNNLLEGEWKIDKKATLEGMIDFYLAEEYSPEEIAANHDIYYGMALVEASTEIDDIANSVNIEFSGTDCNINIYDTCLICRYSISEANELNLTYQGESLKLGVFDKNYTKLTFSDDSGYASIVFSKNPESSPFLVWPELYSSNPSVDNIKALIAGGADVNAGRDYNGDSALMYAIDEELYGIAMVLIEAGADVNAQNLYGKTALYYELYNQEEYAYVALVKAMIAHGADVNKGSFSSGRSPLMFACYNCSNEIKLALIEAGADVNAKDEDGKTALYYELWYHDEEASFDVVKAMIEHGVDVDACKINGLSARRYAAEYCSAEIAALL